MRKTINFLGCLALVVSLASCYNTKRTGKVWVYGNQTLYQTTSSGGANPTVSLETFSVDTGGVATISEKTDHLHVAFLNKRYLSSTGVSPFTKKSLGYHHFPHEENQNEKLKLRYLEQSPVFQAVSVPFKLRLRANDSIPYQVSTSVNAGFSFGWQFTHKTYRNIYHDSGKFLKPRIRQFSFAPSVFFGPTAIALKSGNTSNEVKKDRTIMGLSAGAMMVFGVSRFDIGLAAGLDYGLGKVSKNWIYQGQPWFGLVVGFEFIK